MDDLEVIIPVYLPARTQRLWDSNRHMYGDMMPSARLLKTGWVHGCCAGGGGRYDEEMELHRQERMDRRAARDEADRKRREDKMRKALGGPAVAAPPPAPPAAAVGADASRYRGHGPGGLTL